LLGEVVDFSPPVDDRHIKGRAAIIMLFISTHFELRVRTLDFRFGGFNLRFNLTFEILDQGSPFRGQFCDETIFLPVSALSALFADLQ